MSAVVANKSLKWFAVLTAGATFVLVWMGGLVTSHGAGLAVPDWPNTYGYNMFFFPVSKWVGGIFYEHTHRLVASGVGLLTTILALWFFGRSARPVLRWGGILFCVTGGALCLIFPARAAENVLLSSIGLMALAASYFWPNCDPSPKWLRVLGVVAFAAVVTQGVLGGLRVTELKDQIGIFHGTLAQLFFCLVSAIALFHSEFWRRLAVREETDTHRFRAYFVTVAAIILFQLILGATMRHQHAGLSIPDFPLAYGKLWPNTDAASVARYNQLRIEVSAYKPITAFQVELQMIHRIVALIIFTLTMVGAWRARRLLGSRHVLSRLAMAWFCLILIQVFLGAATIWTGKSADVATAHVACGAVCLMTGALTSIISFRMLAALATVCVPEKNELTSLLASSSMTTK